MNLCVYTCFVYLQPFCVTLDFKPFIDWIHILFLLYLLLWFWDFTIKNLQDFIKIYRALIKDIFLSAVACRIVTPSRMSVPSSIQFDIQSIKKLEVKTTFRKCRLRQTASGPWMFSITLPVMQYRRSCNDKSSRSYAFSLLSLTASFSSAAIKIFACWP